MKKIITFIFLSLFSICAFSQIDNEVHYKGLIMNDEEYVKVPEQPMQLTRGYESLPTSYSLQTYCPTPKHQGSYGTCTSWACAYAARTIVEAIQNGWTSTEIIDKESFSPSFIYKQIKNIKDTNCQAGSSIANALALMQKIGVPRYSMFNPMCADTIPTNIFTDAYSHRIEGYSRLFSIDADQEIKIKKTKKALSENCPVLIGMKSYASFNSVNEVWNGNKDKYEGGHAMCVVGYDDQKFGGAFLIMNSWGTDWGIGGFCWVKYSDFASCTKYAFQIDAPKKVTPSPTPVVNPNPVPATESKPIISWLCSDTCNTTKFVISAGINSKSKIHKISVLVNGNITRGVNSVTNDGFEYVINQEVLLQQGKNIISIEAQNASGSTIAQKEISCILTNANTLSGSMYIQLATGEKMDVLLDGKSSIPTYTVTQSYISGTRYRVYLSNNEPAYVYVISSDLTNNVTKVFPPADNISPALMYKSNSIALPDEKWYMEMDNTKGTDYVCVLYSKNEININDLIAKLKPNSGNFVKNLEKALAPDIAKRSDITLDSNNITFSAQTSGCIVPIVLEIDHK